MGLSMFCKNFQPEPLMHQPMPAASSDSSRHSRCNAARRLRTCAAGVLSLFAWASAPAAIAAPADAAAWLSRDDHKALLAPHPLTAARDSRVAEIRIDASDRKQSMVGFGAAITDSSAYLFGQKMSPAQREALFKRLFAREGDGIGVDFTRITIGASDFSLKHYSLDDTPDNAADPQLAHYDFSPVADNIVPLLKQARAINPRLLVMASPWSAPAWMKRNRSLIQDTLDIRHVDSFARYLARFANDMDAAGVPLFALTLQNEPSYEPKDYPGMRLSAAQRIDLHKRLGPMLQGKVKLFDWDHNWDKPEEPSTVLSDPEAALWVDGIAWHCYGGDVSAQSKVHERFPDKDAYLTECSGGDWEPVKSNGISGQVRTLIVGTTRHWARGVLFWNMALDEKNGPFAGGCMTCRGVVTIHADGSATPTDDWYILGHASRFVLPDAHRVASEGGPEGIDHVAFVNPDGSRVLVVSNVGKQSRMLRLSEGATRLAWQQPARSVITLTWPVSVD